MRDTDAGALDGDKRFDRAVGPMQFLPSTWAVVAVDGDDDGKRNVEDINDAALGSAVYLCAGNGDLSTKAGAEAALLRYNHSKAYVAKVMAIAGALRLSSVFTAVDTRPITRRSWRSRSCRTGAGRAGSVGDSDVPAHLAPSPSPDDRPHSDR